MTLTRLLLAAATLTIAGCASDKPPSNSTYDLGPALTSGSPAASNGGAVVVTDVTGSAALDNERMSYRLNYADPLQARHYANSRWSATPLQMLTQRLKTRIAQSGTKVLSATDASGGVPILRAEVDDFSHSFDGAAQSHGLLALRVSLFQGHKLIDQKTFSRKSGAASADAAGGARALAAAADGVAADIVAWLATQPTRAQ
ncbi:MAG: ABC-type transport auxiliary lipoprotein family protein [Pseudomonadota bacterium]